MTKPTPNPPQHRGYLRFKRSRNALVLEDNRITCWMIARTLRQSGWEVTVTGAIAEAINLVDETLEIAFVDINLPDGNGIKFIEHLTKVAPAVRIIICTADNTSEAAVQAMEAGAYDFMLKPLVPRKIIETSRRALGAKPDLRLPPQD